MYDIITTKSMLEKRTPTGQVVQPDRASSNQLQGQRKDRIKIVRLQQNEPVQVYLYTEQVLIQ